MTAVNEKTKARLLSLVEAVHNSYGNVPKFMSSKELNEIHAVAGVVLPSVLWDHGQKISGLRAKVYDLTDICAMLSIVPNTAGYSAAVATDTTVQAVTPNITAVFENPAVVAPQPRAALQMPTLADNTDFDSAVFVPNINKNYVLWGHHSKIATVIKSNTFFPMLVTGHTGNGKTEMVEQICAKLKRSLVKVNLTDESDEAKLIGGIILIHGNTVWKDGPVLQALRSGSVLLLDEVDLAGEKLLCLQSIMEGKPYLIKKTGEIVEPKAGFTIIATSNTKGMGNISGRYHGTKIMNAAFLDRINITFEQNYPSEITEAKILRLIFKSMNQTDLDDKVESLIVNLTKWSNAIRKSFENDVISELISTRRLISIIKTYSMFTDVDFAVESSIARFDDETKIAINQLWRACYAASDETPS